MNTSSPVRDAAVTAGAAVRLTGLRKSYGEVRAVDGIDLTIAPGEVVALLGPNGAGKSTTVDMILGLSKPDTGDVTVFGSSPAEAVKAGSIGAMLQGGALLDDATVGEMVTMVASLHRNPMPVREALSRAGIEDLANRRGNKLSGGQKQRARFAVALVSDPDLLLLDEPTAAMDVASRREFWRSMQAFTDSGRTVMFATHYLEEAEEFADRVVLMRSGRIVADGSVAQVRALAGGRTLRAVVPGATGDAIANLPCVTEFRLRGGQIAVSSSDSDKTLRALLTAYPDAHDIEITAVGLEGAFLTLTSEEQE
ncbi:ABC transporter ATP-binding protein [Amycolatopsis pithecellobii]|uniref:ATP-binding cassette domain-containing protein n=1 Tax=Amycolatopsis pithecellobii TaxID=664692 RepID=A0A6N7Z3W6_9PSEU|nr:ABC transporter ATP-binding protein [Amycolatopsis pithecellobii]MTD54870.1 ATP-binding cassette domain-containing protein [Amycolatopsis pithecellobii]